MGKGCINEVLDETKYSSQLMVIGFYIAAGSVVCMIFMLFDIISAFHQRKQRWIPCRLFSLNSLTLTLLSISTKIPLDLTTSMPGVYDQLAKITGTTLVYISMGFLSPSIGDNNDLESLTNVVALAIFVITVAVNISMQISTGVIHHHFVGEHIILMICMFVLLFVLWVSAVNINKGKDISLDINKNLLIKGEGSILQRLKLSYLHGVSSNPQFRICAAKPHLLVVSFSLISFGVLVQATFRCLIMNQIKVCQETSDYKRSMKMIVLCQILTVIVGGLAISFRWISAASNILNDEIIHEEIANTIIRKNPILRARLWDIFLGYIQKIPLCLIVLPGLMVWVPMTFLTLVCCCGCIVWVNREQEEATLGEYKDVVGEHELKIYKWIARKAVKDMNSWMDVSRKRRAITLSELFSRINPSPLLLTLKLDDVYPDQSGIEVSSLSMALLVKIAVVSLPHNLSVSLERSFDEAYKIIVFIETRIKSATLETRMKTKFAQSVLLGGGFDSLLQKIMAKSGYVKEFQFQNELTRALVILKDLKTFLPSDVVADEVGAIMELINRRDYQTIQDLCNYIEQIYVDMLHLFLVQFPNAIYKQVMESAAEEFEERVSVLLKLMWKMELLEDQVNWIFPRGSSISGLITPRTRDSLSDSNAEILDVSIQP